MTDAEIVAALVKKLDSTTALAGAVGVTPQAVSNWQKRNRVGWHVRPAVHALAVKHRIRVPTDWIWQQPSTEAA